MGADDPNYSNPPEGWLKGSGELTIQCYGGFHADQNSHFPGCIVNGGSEPTPAIPVSGCQDLAQPPCTSSGLPRRTSARF